MIYDEYNLNNIEGWLLPEEAQRLHCFAKMSHRALEIGSFMGRSTVAILSALPKGPHSLVIVDTFDARGTSRSEEFSLYEANQFRKFVENIANRNLPMPLIVVGESYQIRAFKPQFDFVFIDGSHDEDSVKDDFQTVREVALPGCIVAIHDYGDVGREGLTKAVRDFFHPNEPITGAGSIAWGRI